MAASSLTKPSALPLSRYLNTHLLVSLMLLFSFLYLPRSALSFTSASNSTKQTTSADRPEHPFLTPITSNPTATLLWELAGVAFSMVWWGGVLRKWWMQEKEAGSTTVKDASVEQTMRTIEDKQKAVQRQLMSILEAMYCTVGASIVVFVLIILLGAPVGSHHLRTYLLALHLSFLTIYPLINSLGLPSIHRDGAFDRFRLTRLLCELDPRSPVERATAYPIYGTVIGAWLGVVPFALDWDRPWQSYPLPPTFFSILGFILGGLLSFTRSAVEQTARDLQEDAAEAVAAPGGGEGKSGSKRRKRKSVKTL